MVIKAIERFKNHSENIQWIGDIVAHFPISHLVGKKASFYNKCIFGPLTISIGDYVLVSNVDSAEPDTSAGCDVAKITYLYELHEKSTVNKFRAIVQWYSRPQCVPRKAFDRENICIDFSTEVIEEYRVYDNDISINTIFQKCTVYFGDVNETAMDILKRLNSKQKSIPSFVCRYKFAGVEKTKFRLMPLNLTSNVCNQTNTYKTISRDCSNPASSDENYNTEYLSRSKSICNLENNKVSPIKIIGGCSVVRLSTTKKIDHQIHSDSKVKKIVKSASKSRGVRRNLNLSLNDDSPNQSNHCYSVIKDGTDDHTNNIKIKLRISERLRSISTTAEDTDSAVNKKRNAKFTNVSEDCFESSSKRSKDSPDSKDTPIYRRKSILKSGNNRVAFGTPKRSIQLSNIIQKRIFQDDDVINTPKRHSLRHPIDSIGTSKNKVLKSSARKSELIKTCKVNPTIKHRYSTGRQVKCDLHIAREQLHVSAVPKSLPCREKEFYNIYTFLESKIKDQFGGCMYISGVPGTGKTATVNGVIRILQQKVADQILPAFEYLEINGMRLTDPKQAYVQIYKQLTNKTVSSEHAYTLLEKRFTKAVPHRKSTVLVVDELDILCNRRQDVVYNLLDWPTKGSANLVVVTIANTMDLPERLLMGKVTSRLGLTRLSFQPYTHKQLQEIVTARFKGLNVINSDAVQLVARKVAAVSGDARRALDICRRAIEIFDESKIQQSEKYVDIQHVQKALVEMIASAKVQAIKNCSLIEQLFLQAIVAEITRTGVEEVSFIGVHTQMETLAALKGLRMPTPGYTLQICSKLGSARLIICEHSRNDVFQKILLNVSVDDIHFALRVNSAI